MTLQEETKCIATPGFAGFVPSLKYQFGLTYGNATRHILRTDPSLKKGQIQQEISRKMGASKASTQVAQHDEGTSDALVWKVQRNKYATGDDRFSFPPVPGYTGNACMLFNSSIISKKRVHSSITRAFWTSLCGNDQCIARFVPIHAQIKKSIASSHSSH